MKTTTSAAGLVIAASVFSSIACASVTMDWVTVGNAGNAPDPLTGFGAVAYEYQIGKYEVTNAQYGAFLNAAAKTDSYGLYHSNMSTYGGITRIGSPGTYSYTVSSVLTNHPVVYVSWFSAARFANWMHNGQGDGSMENGSYTLLGKTSGIVTKNTGAKFYIPTENEWYKAAYYNGATSTYSLYPNGQNTITTADANYWSSGTTDVGIYSGDASFYGTFDQGGNVWEPTDDVIYDTSPFPKRALRGGSWLNGPSGLVSTDLATDSATVGENNNTGFRLAAVPEPSSMLLTILTGGVMLISRKR
jgi:sulfatase modifying factor 1